MTELYNLKELKRVRRKLRGTMPKGEVLLWKRLKSKQLGFKFRRQFSIENYVIDFFCTELNLAIEIDGLSHENALQADHDKKRGSFLESKIIKVIHFTSEEVFSDNDRVVQNIYEICNELKGIVQ